MLVIEALLLVQKALVEALVETLVEKLMLVEALVLVQKALVEALTLLKTLVEVKEALLVVIH